MSSSVRSMMPAARLSPACTMVTSGESVYGIPELQSVLNAAVAAEYEANAEDAE